MAAEQRLHEATDSLPRIRRMFRSMLVIREFEEEAQRSATAGFISGPVHQSIGQEAVAVGVCANLRTDDLIHSNHRGHGHAIAKGASPRAMMAELFGRSTGTNRGKGGSMHIADFSVGMMGANGILADGVTLAVGAAQAVSLKGEDRVVTAFVGDGTTNRGPFFEGLNWAQVYRLPLLIVCENNVYASSTLTTNVTAGGGPSVRAAAFDIPAIDVDGNDPRQVDAVAGQLVEEIRRGGGPRFLHARTYRIKGHITRDTLSYRADGETEAYMEKEPVARCRSWLIEQGVDPSDLEADIAAARDLIAEAVEAAKGDPFPDSVEAYEDMHDCGGMTWLS